MFVCPHHLNGRHNILCHLQDQNSGLYKLLNKISFDEEEMPRELIELITKKLILVIESSGLLLLLGKPNENDEIKSFLSNFSSKLEEFLDTYNNLFLKIKNRYPKLGVLLVKIRESVQYSKKISELEDSNNFFINKLSVLLNHKDFSKIYGNDIATFVSRNDLTFNDNISQEVFRIIYENDIQIIKHKFKLDERTFRQEIRENSEKYLNYFTKPKLIRADIFLPGVTILFTDLFRFFTASLELVSKTLPKVVDASFSNIGLVLGEHVEVFNCIIEIFSEINKQFSLYGVYFGSFVPKCNSDEKLSVKFCNCSKIVKNPTSCHKCLGDGGVHYEIKINENLSHVLDMIESADDQRTKTINFYLEKDIEDLCGRIYNGERPTEGARKGIYKKDIYFFNGMNLSPENTPITKVQWKMLRKFIYLLNCNEVEDLDKIKKCLTLFDTSECIDKYGEAYFNSLVELLKSLTSDVGKKTRLSNYKEIGELTQKDFDIFNKYLNRIIAHSINRTTVKKPYKEDSKFIEVRFASNYFTCTQERTCETSKLDCANRNTRPTQIHLEQTMSQSLYSRIFFEDGLLAKLFNDIELSDVVPPSAYKLEDGKTILDIIESFVGNLNFYLSILANLHEDRDSWENCRMMHEEYLSGQKESKSKYLTWPIRKALSKSLPKTFLESKKILNSICLVLSGANAKNLRWEQIFDFINEVIEFLEIFVIELIEKNYSSKLLAIIDQQIKQINLELKKYGLKIPIISEIAHKIDYYKNGTTGCKCVETAGNNQCWVSEKGVPYTPVDNCGGNEIIKNSRADLRNPGRFYRNCDPEEDDNC